MKKIFKKLNAVLLALVMSAQVAAIAALAETAETQLLVDDPVVDISKMSASEDWGYAFASWGTWKHFECSEAKNILYTNSVNTYAEYQSGKGKVFANAKIRVGVERSTYSWSGDAITAAIKNAMLASTDGKNFAAVDADNIAISFLSYGDDEKKATYDAEITLPSSVKALKIAPNAASWQFFLIDVKIYGTEAQGDDDLLIDDMVSDTSKMSDSNNWGVAPSGWGTWSEVGLSKAQNVLYSNGLDTYATYRVDKKTLTYAELGFTLERSAFDWSEDKMKKAIYNSLKASSDGTTFEPVSAIDVTITKVDGAAENKAAFAAKAYFPDETTAVKIEPNIESAWYFFFTRAKIYGKENYRLNKLELKVNGSVSELASGTVSGEATIWNRSGSAVTPAFITAIFEQDGSLKTAAIAAVQEIGIGEEKTLTAEIMNYVYAEGDSVRYFVFKNANTIQPMFPLEDLNQ